MKKQVMRPVVQFTLVLPLLAMATASLGQTRELGPVPDFTHVEQQAMALKQSILTYTEDQRQDLISEAEAALTNFDQRIDNLDESIDARSEQMSSAARRYADSLMSTLNRQRQELADEFDSLRAENSAAWDEVIHEFSSAYYEFYDSWEVLESQFGGQ